MGVKVRAVDTGKLRLTADDHAAASAHARAVHHDRVERDDGLDSVGAGHVSKELHHNVRADGNDAVKLGLAFFDVRFDFILQEHRGKALLAVGAVVRAHDELIGHSFQLFLQDHDVGAAETADEGHVNSSGVHFLGNRIRNGAADTAADDTDLLQALHLGGLAERADKIRNIIALFHRVEHFGRLAGSLDHHGDGSLLTVIAGNGYRNTLPLFVQAENHKLAGLGVFCHERRLNLEKTDALGIIQIPLGYYLIHGCTPFAVLIDRVGGPPPRSYI